MRYRLTQSPFSTPASSPGFSTGTGTTYPYGGITDWTATTTSPLGFNGNVGQGGAFGVYNPTTVSYPDGVNVAFLQGVASSVSISQTLCATLQANDTYTLTAWEGLRDDTAVPAPGLYAMVPTSPWRRVGLS